VYKLVNVMEIMVPEFIDEVLKVNKNLCGCKRCRLDLAAIVLNKLPASYVVTLEGEISLRTNALRQQFRVDIFKVIVEAAEIVAGHPHHNQNDDNTI
jgi:competence protein ComFB